LTGDVMTVSEDNDIHGWFQNARAEAPPELRGRVLAAVEAELARRPAGSRLARWAALVAASVLWLHVSWSAAMNTRLESRAPSSAEVAAAAAELQDLVPELSASEARRIALVLQVGRSAP
jgi:hypothetical protein